MAPTRGRGARATPGVLTVPTSPKGMASKRARITAALTSEELAVQKAKQEVEVQVRGCNNRASMGFGERYTASRL